MENNYLSILWPKYDGAASIAIVFALGVVVMTLNVALILIVGKRSREKLYDEVAKALLKRGWKSGLQLPHSAIEPLIGTSFRVYAPWNDYACVYAFHANAAAVYLGVAKGPEGRGEQANTVIVATPDLRAPVECLISTNSQIREVSQSGLKLICLRPRSDDIGRDLYVYFKDKHPADDHLNKTYRIVGLIFDGIETMLSPDSVALLGPMGLVIRGPVLNSPKNVDATIEPLVAGASHLLDRCEAVWKENRI